MKKKIVVSAVIIVLAYFLVDEYYIKNRWCLAEDWRAGSGYEIWPKNTSFPYNITKQIEKGECECISESLIKEVKPNPLTKIQLKK